MNNIETVIFDFLEKTGLISGKTSCDQIIFRDEFIAKCKANHCGQYNKKWSCPPAIGDIDQHIRRILSYRHLILFSYIGKLDDNYDVENMDLARSQIMKAAYRLKRQLDRKHFDYLMLGAGSCELCSECTYPNKPCRHPDLMIMPIEALGIDVYELAKKCNMKYYNGPLSVTYFCAIMY